MGTSSDTFSSNLLTWLRGTDPPLSERSLSCTISFARICLIAGLVFLHYDQYPNIDVSPFSGIDATQHHLATFINSFILFFFFSVVPLLSMISGWLFFSFDASGASSALRRRMKRRFASLYLPLVFWNVLYLGMLWAAHRQFPEFPLFRELNLSFPTANWLDYVNAVFGVTQHPIALQFWFVRDLFVTALISPLLWWVLRGAPYIGMAILCGAWIIGSGLVVFFRTDVVFFFYLGAFLRIRRASLQISGGATVVLMAIYVTLVVLRALAPMVLDLSGHRPELLTAATRSMRVIGVVACWGLCLRLASTRPGAIVASYGGLAFFLYAIHYPLIDVIKIVFWRWVPAQSDGWMILHYAATVTATLAIGIGGGLLLARIVPRAFALLNGGRLVSTRRLTTDVQGVQEDRGMASTTRGPETAVN